MTATERREEIMRIMVARRQENMTNLAAELGVTTRTIRTDIETLTCQYPLTTVRGNGGGVLLDPSYHPYKNTLSRKQTEVLISLLGRATDEERLVVEDLLREHSNYALDLNNNLTRPREPNEER